LEEEEEESENSNSTCDYGNMKIYNQKKNE